MKAARLYEYDPAMNVQLKIENVKAPTIMGPTDVIVKVGAAGLCRTDLHIIEGVWKDIMDQGGNLLPYIMGYGDDMHCEHSLFPGLGLDGGFAEYFLTSERSLIKLNPNITPLDVAPMADAGITAYRAAKKAAKALRPGAYCVIVGVGGLGHIALQCLHEISGCRIIAVDREPAARQLCKDLGADFVLDGGPNVIEEIKQITGGGAQVVMDFVGELGVENLCWKMVRPGGELIMIGYGGKIEVPTAHLVINEINIGGSLVGNYTELVELMELNADGKVKMHYAEYSLDNINQALDDFKHRRFAGRGVIVP